MIRASLAMCLSCATRSWNCWDFIWVIRAKLNERQWNSSFQVEHCVASFNRVSRYPCETTGKESRCSWEISGVGVYVYRYPDKSFIAGTLEVWNCFWNVVQARAFLAMCCWSLLRSPYWQFACSVELCGSLLWWPILPIQHPALPTPYRQCCMVGIRSGKFLHWSSFSDGAGWWPPSGLVRADRVARKPPCCAWYLRGALTNLCWL